MKSQILFVRTAQVIDDDGNPRITQSVVDTLHKFPQTFGDSKWIFRVCEDGTLEVLKSEFPITDVLHRI